MAQIDVINDNTGQSMIMIVTEAVGQNWGLPEDVMLVNALLQIVLINMGHPAS